MATGVARRRSVASSVGRSAVRTTDTLAAMRASCRTLGLREVTGRLLVATGVAAHLPRSTREQPEQWATFLRSSGLNLNFNRACISRGRGVRANTLVAMACALGLAAPGGADRPDADRGSRRRRLTPTRRWRGAINGTVAAGALGDQGARWLAGAPARRLMWPRCSRRGAVERPDLLRGTLTEERAEADRGWSSMLSAPLGRTSCATLCAGRPNLTAEVNRPSGNAGGRRAPRRPARLGRRNFGLDCADDGRRQARFSDSFRFGRSKAASAQHDIGARSASTPAERMLRRP